MKKVSGLELTMYILAGVFCIVFGWMLISSITYLNDYASQYGVTIGSMFGEALKYIVSQSVSYLAFAGLFFAAGQIVRRVDMTGDILVAAMFDDFDLPEECEGCEAETCEGCEVVADAVVEPEECKDCKEESCEGCEVNAEPQAEPQAEAQAERQLIQAQADADAAIIAANNDAEIAKISADSAAYPS